jgi:hypothetical protein
VIEEQVESMQINHRDVDKVLKGRNVAVKLKNKVRVNDKVYLIKDKQ